MNLGCQCTLVKHSRTGSALQIRGRKQGGLIVAVTLLCWAVRTIFKPKQAQTKFIGPETCQPTHLPVTCILPLDSPCTWRHCQGVEQAHSPPPSLLDRQIPAVVLCLAALLEGFLAMALGLLHGHNAMCIFSNQHIDVHNWLAVLCCEHADSSKPRKDEANRMQLLCTPQWATVGCRNSLEQVSALLPFAVRCQSQSAAQK